MEAKEKFSKAYRVQETEGKIYVEWKKSGYFNPDRLPGKRRKPFVISMPPPNATGELHIGHALFITLQDLMIRFERMRGRRALWLPGVDHAAIATQNVVEKELSREGKTKYNLGREAFVARVEDYVERSKDRIHEQIEKVGASCDWSRERYTLDSGLTRAVQTLFVQMYEDGLIYRGDRIVSWCPRCESTLADDEVEYREEKTKLYTFRYGPLSVATVRPETALGDTALAVHPKDQRYTKFVGETFRVPWVKRGTFELRVVADQGVDPSFGTGVVKVTPAHSAVDFKIAERHHLPTISVIGKDGIMTKEAGEQYRGLSIRECREKFIQELERRGLLENIQDEEHRLSICYRCETPIEPLISKQWFVAVDRPITKQKGKTLKEMAMEVVKTGKIRILPDRFRKIYLHWMGNLHDWCISRQIWFGHRIPVWYCCADNELRRTNSGNRSRNSHDVCPPIVTMQKPYRCPSCNSRDLKQDPDVLDTWFSSSLWTFSTLGWPENTKDLRRFHPTDVMETGYDILFFWVARMIMMTMYAIHEIPFRIVYLNGLVRDRQGRKMSKSLQNGIDPVEMCKKFGADAVRLSLVIGNAPGNDIRLYEEKVSGYQNFVNKLWNISRFILMTVETPRVIKRRPHVKTLADRWILQELDHMIDMTTEDLEQFRFSQAGERLYDFTWRKLADWYLEIAKIEGGKDEILLYLLKNLLTLWHPFTPFVTETIWQHFFGGKPLFLLIAPWPRTLKKKMNPRVQKEFLLLQDLVIKIRTVRSEFRIDPLRIMTFFVSSSRFLGIHEKMIGRLTRSIFTFVSVIPQSDIVPISVRGMTLFLDAKQTIDIERERRRISVELESAQATLAKLQRKISDPVFLKRAPATIVEQEKKKYYEIRRHLRGLRHQGGVLKKVRQ